MVVPCVLIFQVVNREFQDQHCCAVCLDLLYEPFKCSCDHVFCDPCLRQLNFRTGSRGMIRCPLCRQIVQHIIPATGMLENLSFHYYTEVVVIIKPLDLPQVDLINFRVEYVSWLSGRANDEVARGTE